ncbi:hypothetical protein Tco_0096833 [Tanacetum coccineum]
MMVLVKVRWDSKRGPELTWERKDQMRSKCPQLFVDSANASSTISPPIRRNYRDSVAFATGCRKIKNCKWKRCNRKIRIPIGMWPCRVEEKITLKEVNGKIVKEIETKIIAKDGTSEGNMIGWLMEDEEELERNEVDSDLESIASSKPKHVELEDTCESGSRPNPNLAEDVPDYPFNSKLRYA